MGAAPADVRFERAAADRGVALERAVRRGLKVLHTDDAPPPDILE